MPNYLGGKKNCAGRGSLILQCFHCPLSNTAHFPSEREQNFFLYWSWFLGSLDLLFCSGASTFPPLISSVLSHFLYVPGLSCRSLLGHPPGCCPASENSSPCLGMRAGLLSSGVPWAPKLKTQKKISALRNLTGYKKSQILSLSNLDQATETTVPWRKTHSGHTESMDAFLAKEKLKSSKESSLREMVE